MGEEPHVRHPDGQLFKPDLVVHKDDLSTIIADVQVCWISAGNIEEVHAQKLAVYNNQKFLEAATRRWPGKRFIFTPITIEARELWPRCNKPGSKCLDLTYGVKAACIQNVLKWGSTLHTTFMRESWRRRGRYNNNPK